MNWWQLGFGKRTRPVELSPLAQVVRANLEQQAQKTGSAGAAPSAPLKDAQVSSPSEKLRAQLLRYELFSNSGRFQSRDRDVPRHLDERSYAQSHPFKWLVVPLTDDTSAGAVQMLAPKDDAHAQQMLARLTKTLDTPDGPLKVALLPLHPEEAKTLTGQFPGLIIVDDGEMFQTASPRSVLFDARPEATPKLVDGIADYAVKMHLSEKTYARMGGFDGSRVLDKNDCLMANVFSDVTRALGKKLPRMEVQGEDATICATIGTGADAIEIGAILRSLPEKIAVPGFALFSPTKERLPHVKDLPGPLRARVDGGEERVLAADAIAFLQKKNPGLSKEDAFVRLFGEPLLDVVVGLYAQGATLELHPQNFLLRFDDKTGDVEKVVVRDLHGINYSAQWRAEHGLPDLCSVEALQERFPGITQKDIDGWFKRPNPETGVPELRDRYKAPGFYGRNFDVYISVFLYQSLVALEECGFMTRGEVDRTMIKLRDTVEAAADKHGFDLAQLNPGGNQSFTPTMKVAFASGMRGRILFRRPTDPDARAAYIEKFEKPVLDA